jgi:hypothetical protein
LVLRPGERIFLERFLDTNNKFQFSTYSVDNTFENQTAIELNGDVRVEFYDEQQFVLNNYNLITTLSRPWSENVMYGGNLNLTSSPTFTTSNGNVSGICSSSQINSNTYYSNTTLSVETGRVEKGEKSNQNFQNSYEKFNSYISHQILYKIQPLTTKNKTSQDIRQYCTDCGVKLKSNFKFCPSCGHKL